VSLLALLLVGAVLGTVIGMLGGGGGVLAVPMLVAIGEPVLSASTMSLVDVGTGAAAALVPHQRAHRVDWRVGLVFGALGSVGAVVGARLSGALPPDLLLLGFGVLVLLGAIAMLRAARRARAVDALRRVAATTSPGADQEPPADPDAAPAVADELAAGAVPTSPMRIGPKVVLLATGVGLVTGLFGVGAGFVVVPASSHGTSTSSTSPPRSSWRRSPRSSPSWARCCRAASPRGCCRRRSASCWCSSPSTPWSAP